MIIPYIAGMEKELKIKAANAEQVPEKDKSAHTVIESNRNVLMPPPEENSFELIYKQYKEKIEKERFERELLARNK